MYLITCSYVLLYLWFDSNSNIFLWDVALVLPYCGPLVINVVYPLMLTKKILRRQLLRFCKFKNTIWFNI